MSACRSLSRIALFEHEKPPPQLGSGRGGYSVGFGAPCPRRGAPSPATSDLGVESAGRPVAERHWSHVRLSVSLVAAEARQKDSSSPSRGRVGGMSTPRSRVIPRVRPAARPCSARFVRAALRAGPSSCPPPPSHSTSAAAARKHIPRGVPPFPWCRSTGERFRMLCEQRSPETLTSAVGDQAALDSRSASLCFPHIPQRRPRGAAWSRLGRRG
jgi:hypothetical protein